VNIKRVIRKSNLEEVIIFFTNAVPLSLCIKNVSRKTVLTLSNTDQKPLKRGGFHVKKSTNSRR